MPKQKPFVLSKKQLKIVENEHNLHVAGEGRSYTREQARQIIKGVIGYDLKPIMSPLPPGQVPTLTNPN